jgi:hypothetical protein
MLFSWVFVANSRRKIRKFTVMEKIEISNAKENRRNQGSFSSVSSPFERFLAFSTWSLSPFLLQSRHTDVLLMLKASLPSV